MPSRQLLSRRLHGSGAVRCWILPKLAWCEESERVHSVSSRVGLRNWLDLARPVRSRYSRAEHFVERVRRVRCRHLPIRVGHDYVCRLPCRALLLGAREHADIVQSGILRIEST